MSNCWFTDNEILYFPDLTPLNCGTNSSGALSLNAGDFSILNCAFLGNGVRGGGSGGAMAIGPEAKAGITNCTFAGNRAGSCFNRPDISSFGGGIWVTSVGGEEAVIANSIFWQNLRWEPTIWVDLNENDEVDEGELGAASFDGMAQIAAWDTIPIVKHSVVQHYDACNVEGCNSPFVGINPELGNTLGDPFIDLAVGTLRILQLPSSAVDTGNSALDVKPFSEGFDNLPLFDLGGGFRILNGDGNGNEELDMGAFEYQP